MQDYTRAIELDASNVRPPLVSSAWPMLMLLIGPRIAQGAFFFNRALALFEMGRLAEAMLDYSAACRDPKHAFRALYSRGNVYRSLGRLGACAHVLNLMHW